MVPETRRKFLTIPVTLAAQSILDLPAVPADSRIRYGNGESQFADLRVPSGGGPHPIVIVIHGGYWRARYDLAHVSRLCAALTAEGLATWSLEYRRVGNSGGGWPGTFNDIREGAAHLKNVAAEHSLDLRRVVALGHSAGGQLALWLAKQRVIELRGVAPLGPVADLRRAWELKLSDTAVAELLGGSPDGVPERYRAASPIELVPLGIAQRLIHGRDDGVVPISLSQAYVAAAVAKKDDAKLIEVPGAGHFELIDPRTSCWPIVKRTVLGLVQ